MRLFARGVIANALARQDGDTIRTAYRLNDDGTEESFIQHKSHGGSPVEIARARWGAHAGLDDILHKDAVGGVTSTDVSTGRGDHEFFASVLEASIVGRLAGLRRVPFNTRLIKMTDALRGYWVSEFAPIPLSKPALQGSSLPRRKIGAIMVTSLETLESIDPKVEALFETDLRRAVVGALDEAFIAVANVGISDKTPASVTSDASPIVSSGNPAEDIRDLIADFAGDLSAAYFVTDPLTAAEIALARDAGGAFLFPDVGPRGGSILGIPLLTSRNSPRDSAGGQIALIDPTGIAAALEGVEVARSTSAALTMSDSPEASGDAGEFVPLFTTDSVALKVIIHANWENQRAGGVSVIASASYGSAS